LLAAAAACHAPNAAHDDGAGVALPARHLLVLRCLMLKGKDTYAWDKIFDLEARLALILD
jgi:hypothetical protein